MSLYTLQNVASCRGMQVTDGVIDAYPEYDEFLDSAGVVIVGGLEFYPSRIIEELDPTAYNCGYNDWVNSYQCELEDAIENEDYGDVEWIEDPEDEDEEE